MKIDVEELLQTRTRHLVNPWICKCQHPILLVTPVGCPDMQGVDRCGCYFVSCLLAKRRKREATHSADYCKSSECLHSTQRILDLEVRLRSADAERERHIDSHCLPALSGEAQKARCHRGDGEATDTCLAEVGVAAVTVTVTEAAAAMLEGSCLVAPARYDSFHLAVAARFAEDSMQVVAASLECI